MYEPLHELTVTFGNESQTHEVSLFFGSREAIEQAKNELAEFAFGEPNLNISLGD